MTSPILLYVEDDENDIFFMRRGIKQLGVPVTLQTASTGPDAIAYLSGAEPYGDRAAYPLPTIVLLDINLPGCSGFDVLKWLREQPQFAQLPVFIFSSSARPEDVEKARALGVTDYLQKPASGLAFSETAKTLQRYWLARSSPAGDGMAAASQAVPEPDSA